MKIPETRYARSREISIAYQVHGGGDHDLLFSGTTASNVETVWQFPEAHRLFERLGRFARVIRFDRRDSGVSDPIRDDLTVEAHAADALAVMDAVGAQRPVVLGGSDGARSMATLAATRPARVRSMIALSPSARGGAVESPEIADTVARSFGDLDWPGRLIEVWAPNWAADPALRERFDRYVRTSTTPRQAQRLLRMSLTSDMSQALGLVQAPTLVLRPTATPLLSREVVRGFADLIPGAVYREIPGEATLPYALDVDLLADEIEEFVTGTSPSPISSRVLATVLFTDLVGSTTRAAELGDRAWTTLLDRHQTATRASVSRHGGEAVKMLGDGALATFAGPAQAVRCAEEIIGEAQLQGLEVRAGLHVGEVERTHDDIAGLAVHLAARIMDRASASEILVSRTVRDLVVGSELTFAHRGEHCLKGIPESWELYAVA